MNNSYLYFEDQECQKKEEEEEELLLRERTNDDDDDDDGEDSSCEEYDDDDDSTDSNGWSDVIVWSAWRQHTVAIIVAIVATILAFLYQQQQQQQQQLHYRANTHVSSSSSSPVFTSTFPHEHLQGYDRTANISFCAVPKSQVHQHLQVMDFHVPLEYLDALKLQYAADALEDDDYSQVLGSSSNMHSDYYGGNNVAALNYDNYIQNPEYHCLNQLASAVSSTSSKSYVTGYTYFYQPPSYIEMFPQVAEQTYESNALTVTGLAKARTKLPQPASLSFTGFAAKFINLSPHPLLLFWDGKGGIDENKRLVGELAPFDSLGTATTPGQSFHVTPVYDSSHALDRWVLTADDAIVVYEPENTYSNNNNNNNKLTTEQQQLYHMQKLNLEFAKHYLIASHRHWLAHFPRRFPVHPLHPAEYVGQTHTVVDNAATQSAMALKVVSVTPRVLEIDNFLSDDECHHLIYMAQQQGLHGSTLYAGGMAQQQQQQQQHRSTRSSTNTWLGRDTSHMTDEIYKRAAMALKMKQELLQQSPPSTTTSSSYYEEEHDDENKKEDIHSIVDHAAKTHSIAESLQVVRYQPGQEYTAHHDFVYPSLRHRYQPTRYATLLMYLNDDFTGGQTNFPRAIHPSNHEGLTVTPKRGKAVLFYNILPDGNVDDLSQHRSMPVETGEKWLANLWVWDPVIN